MASDTTGNRTADEIGDDIEPLADETTRQAQRVVAAFAADADECRMFLSMLGIEPQPRAD